MVAEVRSNSALVAHAGKEPGRGQQGPGRPHRTTGGNLEQTAASVHELSGTVQQNARTAGESDQQAAQVRDVAESGAKSMGRAVESVEGIQKSAQQMNEIIGVIDSIAFQTNISPSTPRWKPRARGEQGRGFAVVANEVRTLAQRSAASAKEIRELIEASRSQVEASVAQIRTAGSSIGQIVTGVRGVAANMSLISASSAEQSTGLSEISSAVTQARRDHPAQRADGGTRGRTGRATRTPRGHLSKAVSSFMLQQGTAREAMQLVGRAQAMRPAAWARGLCARGHRAVPGVP